MLKAVGMERYVEILDKMGLNQFPRTVGFPYQRPVFDYEGLYIDMLEHDGKTPVFISTSSYPSWVDNLGHFAPLSIRISEVFNDFDDAKKPENAQRDALKLYDHLDGLGISALITFSAGKGFHVHIPVKSQLFSYDTITRQGVPDLGDILWAMQNKFKVGLDLTTMDVKCMGTPTRVFRAPYTDYVNIEGRKNGNVCCILTREMAGWPLPQIITYSKKPTIIVPEFKYKLLTLEELIDAVGYTPMYAKAHNISPVHNPVNISDTKVKVLMNLLRTHSPCVWSDMQTHNPSHTTRVAFALFCKHLGMNIHETNAVYESLGTVAGYVDLHNTEYRMGQIKSIIDNEKLQLMGCKKLKRSGLCLGIGQCIITRSGL